MSSPRTAQANSREIIGDITKTIISLRMFETTIASLKNTFNLFGRTTQTVLTPLKNLYLGQNLVTQAMKQGLIKYRSQYTSAIGKQLVSSQSPLTFRNKLQTVGGMFKQGLGETDTIGGVKDWWNRRSSQPAMGPFQAKNVGPTNANTIGATQGKGYGLKWGASAAGSVLGTPMRAVSGITNAMVALAKVPFVAVGGAAMKLGPAFGKMIGMKPESIAKVGTALKGIGGSLMDMALSGAAQVLFQLMDALNPFKPLVEALTTIFGVYGDILSTAFTPLIEKLFDVMLSPSVLDMIMLIADAMGQMVIAFLPLVDILTPIGAILISVFLVVLNALLPIIQTLGGLLIPLAAGFKAFSDSLLGGIAGIGTWWRDNVTTPISNWFIGYTNQISGWWADNVTGPINSWISSSASIGRNIGNFFVGILNVIIGMLNAPANSINGVLGAMGIKERIGTIPPVPMLAQGGITTAPMLAVIGDNPSHKEAVIPLDDNGNPTNGKLGQTIINVYGEVTEEKLYKMQRDAWLNNL